MELDEWVHSVFWLSYHCIKCTGLTKKIHFTFESSQEKLQHHRLSTALLLSQQLPSWFPAPDQIAPSPLCLRCMLLWSVLLGMPFSLIPPNPTPPSRLTVCLILQDHSYPHRFLPLCKEHRDHLSWFLIGPDMCLADLRGFSNRLWPWVNQSPNFSMPQFTHLQNGGNKFTQIVTRITWVHICGAFRSPLAGSL